MTFETIKDVVLFALAIYGAGLSTWNLVQGSRRERRKLLVAADTAMVTFEAGHIGEPWAQIRATNVGTRPVTVTNLAFQLDDGRRLTNISSSYPRGIKPTTLPASLSDGASATEFLTYFDVGHALISAGHQGKTRLTPIAEDSAGAVHKGEPWNVDPHQYIKMRNSH